MMIKLIRKRNIERFVLPSYSLSSLINKEIKKTNVVVVGTGAIGLYYGGRLLESELLNQKINIKFLARNYYKVCNDLGFRIQSIDGNKVFEAHQVKDKFYNDAVSLLNSYKDNKSPVIDWVIVAVKSYAINENIRNLLDPLISSNPNVRILLIINGYGVERLFKTWYGSDRVFVSLAFTCINRILTKDNNTISSVVIDHTAVGHLLIGHCSNNNLELAKVKELFSNSKIRVDTSESLIKSVWMNLSWNVCFNGMTVALGAVTTDIIAKDEHLRSLATNVMKEIIELANDDIKDFYIDQNVDATKYFIDESHIDIMWKYTDEMGSYKTSSAIDLVNNTELEVEYIFTNVWNRAIYHSKKKCRALGMNDDKSFYPYIDHLMKMIHGINSIATKKRNLNIKWNATWWNGN